MTFSPGDRVKVREDLSFRSGSISAGAKGKVTSALIGHALKKQDESLHKILRRYGLEPHSDDIYVGEYSR